MKLQLLNFIAFQIGWFACVLGATNELPLLGPVAAMMLLVWHLCICDDPVQDLRLILSVALIGGLIDSLQALAGIFYFHNDLLPAWLAPPWLVALWMIFASTLRSSLQWLAGHYWLAASLGAVGGPLTYYAGYRLGALGFPDELSLSIAVLTVVWALLMPTLMWISTTSSKRLRYG